MIFVLFAGHSDMERDGLTLLTLFRLAVGSGTGKSIFCKMLSMGGRQWFSVIILLGCISGVPCNKLIFIIAFGTLN